MRGHATIAMFCILWVAAACAGPSGPKQHTTSGYRASGEAITVVEFSQDGAQIAYNAPYDAFGLAVAEEIASALRELGHRADAVPVRGDANASIVVVGRIVRITAGSRAQRYWVGFGAGAAKFGVEGSVRNAQGDEVATFSDERWSGFGVFGGNSVSLVQRCLRAVGNDVARMIHSGQYGQVRGGG